MSKYVFDPVVIHEISKRHLGEQPLEQMFANIAADLAETILAQSTPRSPGSSITQVE